MPPSPAPKPRSLFPRRRGAAPRVTACGCGGTAQTAGVVAVSRESISSDTIRSYMRRLEDAYNAMQAAVADIIANAPPRKVDTWRFLNDWQVTYGRWESFYWGAINDFIMADSTYQEAQTYGVALETARKEYKRLFKKAAPGDVIPPKDLPSEPGGPLESVAGILKWGVVGYLAIQVFGLVGDRKK